MIEFHRFQLGFYTEVLWGLDSEIQLGISKLLHKGNACMNPKKEKRLNSKGTILNHL